MILYVGILIASLLVSTSLTWGVRTLALKYKIAPAPDAGHHIHVRPIPRIGGTAIFATVACFFVVFAALIHYELLANPIGRNVFRIVVPAILLFAAGLLDDLRPVRAKTKLLIQIGGGAYLYCCGLHFPAFHFQFAGFSLGAAFSFIATIFWVAWLCNGINFIDGLDGLAAGAAFFLTVPVFVFALRLGLQGIAMFTVVLAGALLGFLVFNLNPATIFLGDSGSLFIGFLFGGFSLAEIKADDYGLRPTAILLVAFALPLFEVALSVWRRALNGRSVFAPDREHIHHQLLQKGFSHSTVVWILYGVSTAFAAFSLLLIYSSAFIGEAACAVFLVLVYGGVRGLGYTEFEQFPRLGRSVRNWRADFARSICVRKTLKLMRRAEDPDQILKALESGLRGGFRGFELVLDCSISQPCAQYMREAGVMGRHWSTAVSEDSELRMYLETEAVGYFGQMIVYWSRKTDLSDDVELLFKALASSIGLRLEPFLEISNRELAMPASLAREGMPETKNDEEIVFATVLTKYPS